MPLRSLRPNGRQQAGRKAGGCPGQVARPGWTDGSGLNSRRSSASSQGASTSMEGQIGTHDVTSNHHLSQSHSLVPITQTTEDSDLIARDHTHIHTHAHLGLIVWPLLPKVVLSLYTWNCKPFTCWSHDHRWWAHSLPLGGLTAQNHSIIFKLNCAFPTRILFPTSMTNDPIQIPDEKCVT